MMLITQWLEPFLISLRIAPDDRNQNEEPKSMKGNYFEVEKIVAFAKLIVRYPRWEKIRFLQDSCNALQDHAKECIILAYSCKKCIFAQLE